MGAQLKCKIRMDRVRPSYQQAIAFTQVSQPSEAGLIHVYPIHVHLWHGMFGRCLCRRKQISWIRVYSLMIVLSYFSILRSTCLYNGGEFRSHLFILQHYVHVSGDTLTHTRTNLIDARADLDATARRFPTSTVKDGEESRWFDFPTWITTRR